MKKRILTISLIVASLVLLVSVGFASWVIQTTHTDTKSGNFEAYNVTNNGTLTVEVCDSAGNTTGTPNTQITYGYPGSTLKTSIENMSGFDKWLDFSSSDMYEEQLVIYLKLSLANSTAPQTFTLTNSFKKSGSVQDVYNLIADPTYAYVSGTSGLSGNEITLSDGQSIVISVTYNWGSVFGGVNPYQHFNLQAKTTATSGSVNSVSYTTYETKANVALSQLFALVSGLSYNITIADKPSA